MKTLQPDRFNRVQVPYTYDPVTVAELHKLPAGTVSEADHRFGMEHCEPLIIAMDSLIRYAKAYRTAYFSKLADDGVLGNYWLDAAKSIRRLLNGNGAEAYTHRRGTDSKDNGAVESMFWAALGIAGFSEEDLCRNLLTK